MSQDQQHRIFVGLLAFRVVGRVHGVHPHRLLRVGVQVGNRRLQVIEAHGFLARHHRDIGQLWFGEDLQAHRLGRAIDLHGEQPARCVKREGWQADYHVRVIRESPSGLTVITGIVLHKIVRHTLIGMLFVLCQNRRCRHSPIDLLCQSVPAIHVSIGLLDIGGCIDPCLRHAGEHSDVGKIRPSRAVSDRIEVIRADCRVVAQWIERLMNQVFQRLPVHRIRIVILPDRVDPLHE
ncbi:hypothetical protein D3C72_1252510 [compost metagenome]